MSKKFNKKISLSRQEAADRMIAIGEALAANAETTLELDGESIPVSVPDRLTFELELKDTELEIELEWVQTSSAEPDDKASHASSDPLGGEASNLSSPGSAVAAVDDDESAVPYLPPTS
jgi:amphi-Trp domain-containing protein